MKKHCISCPTKSLIFCKSLLFFQNKAKIADSYSYKFICIYVVSFYANITKNWNAADLVNQNPTKKVILF